MQSITQAELSREELRVKSVAVNCENGKNKIQLKSI